jgi:hypothetical protein
MRKVEVEIGDTRTMVTVNNPNNMEEIAKACRKKWDKKEPPKWSGILMRYRLVFPKFRNETGKMWGYVDPRVFLTQAGYKIEKDNSSNNVELKKK